MRDVLSLPCSNFQESARALAADDLRGVYRLIESVWEFDALYRSRNWPPEPLGKGAAAGYKRESTDAYSMNVSLICWWSLWRDFPVALALYEYEIIMALKVSNNMHRWHRPDIDVDQCYRRLREVGVETVPTPKLVRRFTKDIEWLGDARFHACHRNYLVHSNRVWYGQYGWRDPNIKLRVDQTVKRTTLFDHVGAVQAWHSDGGVRLPTFAYELWFPDSVVEFAECVRHEHPAMPGQEVKYSRPPKEAVVG
jgi:hypothetical protein